MKKSLVSVCAVLAVLALFAGCAPKPLVVSDTGVPTIRAGVLSVGMEIGYPPMEYYDADGTTPIGFDVLLAKALGEKLGLPVEFEDTSWDGIFAGLETSKYDMIISSVTITGARQEKYIFPQAYISNAQSIVLPEGSTQSITGLESLAGMRVAYQADTTSDDIMTELAEGGLSFTAFEYDKVMNCFDELRTGRVDVIVCDSVVAYYYEANPAYTVNIVWEGEGEELGICIRGGNAALGDAVSEALDELFADGTVQEISRQVFGRDIVSQVRP